VKLTLGQAAKETGLNKSTIYRAIKNGKLSGDFDEITKTYRIDTSELFRVFAPASERPETAKENKAGNVTQQGGAMAAMGETMAELRASIETLKAWNNDLRSELTQEREERRRLTIMLTDQRNAPQSAPQIEKGANNWPLVVLVFLLVAASIAAIFAVRLGLV
jgi:excisionase family DNA binding protein